MPNSQDRILVLGYSPNLEGGVAKVTGLLLKHMPELELHPILFCYAPRYYSLYKSLISFLAFCTKLILHPGKYSAAHIIVGSPGDAVRTIPFILVAALARLQICLQYHKSIDIIMRGLPGKLIRRLVLITWRLADCNAFLSRRLSEIHESIAGDTTTSVIIPNALDRAWHELEVLPAEKRLRDIVFFGRWSWEKGVDDLVKAMSLRTAPALCECYTNPPPGKYFEHCRMLPWVPESEVMQIMRTARILILPSYAEAYPTVLLEAAACGTPFIATDIAGIPDIVNESGAGILIKPGDPGGLASAIDRLLTDHELWQSCSSRGKNWVRHLNTDYIVKEWRDLYRKLLDDNLETHR